MKLLAWDTSTKVGAIGAAEWEPRDPASTFEVRSAWTLGVAASSHSEQLLWALDRVLESCGWRLGDLDFIGVGVGPGSFTGLRIGLTTARTLAQAAGKKLAPFSSLVALARPVAAERATTRVFAAMDACKGEVFLLEGTAAALARCAWSGDSRAWAPRGARERVVSAEALETELRRRRQTLAKTPWFGVGDAGTRYPNAWRALPRGLGSWDPHRRVTGESVARLAFESWSATQGGVDPLAVSPAYLREADATVRLKKGLLRPSPVETGP